MIVQDSQRCWKCITFQGESCAILPWHTLHAAFNSVASTSTEAEEDPMHAPIGNA
jgi:hypothetical protein